MQNLLAIVIPYYKIDFFEETLKSVASQTDKRFTLYIGNDASPDDPFPLIEKYFPEGNYHYFDYKENLGGKNLAMQWERILENVKEEWFQILGDDDVISENFVEEFYRNIAFCKNINLIKVKSIIINEDDDVVFNKSKNLTQNEYSVIDLFFRKQEGEINSSLSEHIFKMSAFKKSRFKKYHLAWHSDDYILLDITKGNDKCLFISNALVTIKETSKSISGTTTNENKKHKASVNFYTDTLRLFKNNRSSQHQKKKLLKFVILRYPQIPAKEAYFSIYPFHKAVLLLICFYSNRIFAKSINKKVNI